MQFSEREAKLRQIVVNQGQKENEGPNGANMEAAEAKHSSDNSANNGRAEMKAEDKLIQEARAAVLAAAAAERKNAEGAGNNGGASAGGEKYSSGSKAVPSKSRARPAWALTEDTAAVCGGGVLDFCFVFANMYGYHAAGCERRPRV